MSSEGIRNTTHRFEDVVGEPCTTLAPIHGFDKKQLVTLEEAIKPLLTIVPRLDGFVHVAKERAKKPADNLSVDESASIGLYTMEWEPYTESVYYILNQALRTEDRQILKPWFSYLKLMLTALSRLPSVAVPVYRGVRSAIENEYEKYQVGNTIIWWGFSSCSKSKSISEKDQFLGEHTRRTLFKINCLRGKDISKHSYFGKEREVLLLPATQVKVIAQEHREGGLHYIRLQEIEPSFELFEQVSTKLEIDRLGQEATRNRPESIIEADSVLSNSERYLNPGLSVYINRCRQGAEVYLIGKQLNESDMNMIAQELLVGKQCRQLFLRESGVSAQGALVLADALRSNNTLERLFMSQNNIGDKGAAAIAEALLVNVTLKELCLGYNEITNASIKQIANLLKVNTTLTHLRLPSNKISDRGLKQLAEVLTTSNKTLQVLSLEWNEFSSETSITSLVQMLQSNTVLKSLNLNSCKLPRSAIKELKAEAGKKAHFDLAIH